MRKGIKSVLVHLQGAASEGRGAYEINLRMSIKKFDELFDTMELENTE
jgi:hypothetical protein